MGVVTSVSKIVLHSCFISIIQQTKLSEKVTKGGFYDVSLGFTYLCCKSSLPEGIRILLKVS